MKIYDISQEVFSSCVWEGDPAPERRVLCSIEKGDVINLTAFSMCAHNGTHIDAPSHFLRDGKNVEEIAISKLVGKAYVADHSGNVDRAVAVDIIRKARAAEPEALKRILVKGNSTLTYDGAEAFAEAGILLYGNESQTVGPEDAPAAVHRLLLGKEIVLLEGIRLREVPEGVYLLFAAPLNLAGAEGAPCRAVLIEL